MFFLRPLGPEKPLIRRKDGYTVQNRDQASGEKGKRLDRQKMACLVTCHSDSRSRFVARGEDGDADEDEESRAEGGGVWKKLKGAEEEGERERGSGVRARVRWRVYKVSGS